MTVLSITTASVGTKLATVSDTKITGLTVTQPSATADLSTPLTLVDAAAAPAAPVGFFRTLFSAALPALTFLFGIKPTGPSLAPGLTPPTWPQGIVTGNIPFTNGVFVQSCPAGVTFSLTTAP
jgi:hypothetical protein